MFSGRVSRGRYPRMTMRSKQWYTKETRLPNSFAKVSIGPPRSFLFWQKDDRAEDRDIQYPLPASTRTRQPDGLSRARARARTRARSLTLKFQICLGRFRFASPTSIASPTYVRSRYGS